MSNVYHTIDCVDVQLTAISMVDDPAISSGWRWISSTELVGPLLVPDRLMFRKNGYFIRLSIDEVINSIFDYFYVQDDDLTFTLQHNQLVTDQFKKELSQVMSTHLWCEDVEYQAAADYGLEPILGAVYLGIKIPEGPLNTYLHDSCKGFSCEIVCGADDSNLTVVL